MLKTGWSFTINELESLAPKTFWVNGVQELVFSAKWCLFMPRPPKPDHVRLIARVPKAFADEVRAEAKRRGKSIGFIIMEAINHRIEVTWRKH